MDSQKSIHYKVLASIRTKNHKVVEEIISHLPEINSTVLSDSIYFLDFNNVVKQNSFQKNYIVNKAELTFLYSSTISENYELQLKYVPGIAKFIFLQMSFSTGNFSGHKEYPGYNIYKLDYETFAYNIGIGAQIVFEEHNFYFGYNYSAKSISFTAREINSKARRENNSFLAIGFVFYFTDKYHFTIGCRYHWPQIDLFPEHNRFSVNGGIGISLFNY